MNDALHVVRWLSRGQAMRHILYCMPSLPNAFKDEEPTIHNNELIPIIVTFACRCLVHNIYLAAIGQSILIVSMRVLHPS